MSFFNQQPNEERISLLTEICVSSPLCKVLTDGVTVPSAIIEKYLKSSKCWCDTCEKNEYENNEVLRDVASLPLIRHSLRKVFRDKTYTTELIKSRYFQKNKNK